MPHPQVLKVGARASPMALDMAETVVRRIREINPAIEMKIQGFVAEGDKIQGSLKPYGGKGTFIKDLEQRLLSGEIDCAVHSLKDIPGDIPQHEDLALVAFLDREDPRDALILGPGVTEEKLREGAILGTSAPRRVAAMKRLFPRSESRLCRGNVNTRLQKLESGAFDAIILSYAGLKRLGMEDKVSRIFETDEVLPAVGQGIMVVQVRRADIERCPFLKRLDDTQASAAATAERAMLFRLQGNCHSAIAGYCSFTAEDELAMRAMVFEEGTGNSVVVSQSVKLPADLTALGTSVAEKLLEQGADAWL